MKDMMKKKKYVKHLTRGTIVLDITGTRFHRLTAIEYVHEEDKWKFLCDCGNIKNIKLANVKRDGPRNGTQSCGCLHKEYLLSQDGKNHSCWRGCGDIPMSYYNRARRGAESRNMEFDITIEDMSDLIIKQNYKCNISGMPIKFNALKKHTASLDRIDNSKGYVKGNVQWLHKDINSIKSNYNQEYFIELCGYIYKNTKNS
jgi:hypothetical protein